MDIEIEIQSPIELDLFDASEIFLIPKTVPVPGPPGEITEGIIDGGFIF